MDFVIELFNCGVFEVIATCYESELGWHYVGLPILCLMRLDAARFPEFFEDLSDSCIQKLFNLFILVARNVVKVGIFEHSSEQKAPCYPLNAGLNIVYLASGNLSINVI